MILVTGARGVVGVPLCDALYQREDQFIAVSRSSLAKADGNVVTWDLQQAATDNTFETLTLHGNIDSVIHCAPIWLLPNHISVLKRLGARRIVVFSSTSVISKQNSNDPQEQQLVMKLSDAEQQLITQCHKQRIDLTIFRPSLIYGYGRDQNVSHISHIIRRYRCMLLVGKANGLRQPVHADDLVQAALVVLDLPQTFNKQYNLAGAERLTYREMVRRIFIGLRRKPMMISIPLSCFRWLLIAASKISSFAYTAQMADRMNMDLIYDFDQANTDFGYQPQRFLENPQRDLLVK